MAIPATTSDAWWMRTYARLTPTAPASVHHSGAVGISRAYVRIHHASDVVAGMAAGAALGLGARTILRRSGIVAATSTLKRQ